MNRLQQIQEHRQPTRDELLLSELQAIKSELRLLRQLLDDFFATYLRAKFPFGKPTDRWAGR